jgi:lipopolysaccharide exporter
MIDKFRTALASKLPPGSFIRNVVTLMTGTTFAQALMILVAPILTRLYTPEDYGVYALYSSILGILAVVACWRYELAIVLPEKDEDAANLLVLSICICFGMALLTLALVALFRNPVANLLGAPELAPWLWFMPLSLIAAGLFQAFNYWSTRRKQFRRLAVRQITQSTVTAATQLGIGFAMRPGPGGLISGSILGQLTATGRLAWQIWKDEGKQLLAYIRRKDLYRVGIRFRKFPIYDSWSGLLNTASTMLPALLLGYFFTPAIVGYYALGHRVLSIPMGVIGGSIAQAFFPRVAEARRTGNIDKITLEMFQKLLAIGLVPMLLITIVAPDLFALVFGSRWWTAGEYVRWLSLWLLFVFISSPLSSLFSVLERQKDSFLINVVQFTTRLAVLVIGGCLHNSHLTVAMFGAVSAILVILTCLYIIILAGVSIKIVLKKTIEIAVGAIPYVVIPIIFKISGTSSLILVLASVLMGLIFVIKRVQRMLANNYNGI